MTVKSYSLKYRAPGALCARQSTAVVIYWATKSQKMSLTTLPHSYQSVSYFSLTLSVTCLSFPVQRESKFPLAWKPLQSFFICSTNFQWAGQYRQRTQQCRCWSTGCSAVFLGLAASETISGLLTEEAVVSTLYSVLLYLWLCSSLLQSFVIHTQWDC